MVHDSFLRIAFLSSAICTLISWSATDSIAQAPAPAGSRPPDVPSPSSPPPADVQLGQPGSSNNPLASPRAGVNRGTILRLLLGANVMLVPLAICSVLTVGYALERWLALRRKRVIPVEFTDRFLERLSSGKLDRDRALELCKANDSSAARIFALVVKSWGQPGATIRQTLSHDAAGELLELKRNLRILNAMATIGPLLGLLGTVVGIIQSFDALGGRAGPARGEALAQGISLALVATAFGLVIAIFAVASYYYLLNRVDFLARELDERARQVIELVSAETLRPGGADRRYGAGLPNDPLRQETRVY